MGLKNLLLELHLNIKSTRELEKKPITYTKEIWLDGADVATVSKYEEVTLMDWGNAISKVVEQNKCGADKNCCIKFLLLHL